MATMPAQGTIFYSWATAHERLAFEALVCALALELDDVRPPLCDEREPVRFWVHEDTRARLRELSRFNGVADSSMFRLAFCIGLSAIETALGAGEVRPVRMRVNGELRP